MQKIIDSPMKYGGFKIRLRKDQDIKTFTVKRSTKVLGYYVLVTKLD